MEKFAFLNYESELKIQYEEAFVQSRLILSFELNFGGQEAGNGDVDSAHIM
jgi:hypothetical protein